MQKKIVVFGATGNLGNRITRELIQKGAAVQAIVRTATDPEKIKALQESGATVEEVDLNSVDALARASTGADCVISLWPGYAR
ncbi:SDR family oxidoreductase [Siphonobacter sp. BAB-5385]|uniref:SDR family oxidoreductase n=1 Tax=Siphonobacter sp. BAB-5385 TaxID=1864822 RepID=UPI0020CE2298|nr:NmrA family NAD(P)-binding protein [Siphonobacter sp. BAB-5385]